jgi:hypothetical protein
MNISQSGQGAVNLAHAAEVALQAAAQIVLAGEVGAVAHPHRQRLGAKRAAHLDAFDVVRHRLGAGGRADGGQAAVFIGVRLPRLILEGVRIDRIPYKPWLGLLAQRRGSVVLSHGKCSETPGVARVSW